MNTQDEEDLIEDLHTRKLDAMPDEVTQAELVRRVERLERLAEHRIVTTDVYTAEKAAHTVEVAALNTRIGNIEQSIQAATRLLIGAFFAIIGQAIFLALSFFGK